MYKRQPDDDLHMLSAFSSVFDSRIYLHLECELCPGNQVLDESETIERFDKLLSRAEWNCKQPVLEMQARRPTPFTVSVIQLQTYEN